MKKKQIKKVIANQQPIAAKKSVVKEPQETSIPWELTTDRTICSCIVKGKQIDLRIGSIMDYKSATDMQLSMGEIKKFKYAGNYDREDESSIWMLMKDTLQKADIQEWISCNIWLEQFLAGIFENQKPVTHGDYESESTEGLPF